MRKDAGLSVTDRIRIQFETSDRVAEAVRKMSDYVKSETLATQLNSGRDGAEHWVQWDIDGEPELTAVGPLFSIKRWDMTSLFLKVIVPPTVIAAVR